MDRTLLELKGEHSELIDLLIRVKVLGVSTEHGQQRMLSARQRLLEHIRKEDELVYPALRQAAEGNEGLRQSLDELALEMKTVSAKASIFFDRYSSVNLDRKARQRFEEDFDSLYHTLLTRIHKEEGVFFKAFEELQRQAR